MPSVPLICSSSGVATVSAMVWGLAPGKRAVTTTEGGTTSGYSLIGNCVIAIRPARKMMVEITPAKIGRSMKNLDRLMACSASKDSKIQLFLILRRLGGVRRARCAGAQFLQAIQDQLVARLQPFGL